MKWNMVFGALVVSVGLCSQSFGFELLDRMLGLNDCGCNSCCETACEPSCGCDKGCEPTCCAQEQSCCAQEQSCCAQEQSCCAAEQSCCAAEPSCGCEQSCCKRRHHGDLFCGLRGLFDCHKCKKSCCEQTCAAEPTCCAAEQSCCAAEPTCCEQPCCKKRRCHRGLLSLFHHKKCCKPACNTGCDSCGNGGCSDGGCGCSGGDAPAPAAGAPAEEAAPMPPAPTPDHSASVKSKRRVMTTASKVARRS